MYDPSMDLQSIVEGRIESMDGRKTILAVNTIDSYYCFSTERFAYDQLLYLKEMTFAVDFILYSRDSDALFVFHEDDPACFVSFATIENFNSKFLDLHRVDEVFRAHAFDWRISDLESQEVWINAVQRCFAT